MSDKNEVVSMKYSFYVDFDDSEFGQQGVFTVDGIGDFNGLVGSKIVELKYDENRRLVITVESNTSEVCKENGLSLPKIHD